MKEGDGVGSYDEECSDGGCDGEERGKTEGTTSFTLLYFACPLPYRALRPMSKGMYLYLIICLGNNGFRLVSEK